MAHSKQARKRVRQNETARRRNKARRSALRTYMKKTLAAVERRDLEEARRLLPEAMKRIDKAAKAASIHRNTAARNKSHLARHLARLERELAGA